MSKEVNGGKTASGKFILWSPNANSGVKRQAGGVSNKKGILLDLGCRDRKEHFNWLGMDCEQYPGVDVVHDIHNKFPYPIPSGSCITIKAHHVAEHVPPKLFFKWMDELWRCLKPDGQLVFSAPYAGSIGFWGDPTHVTHINEITLQHLDPDLPMYHVYKPKPWNIEHAKWSPIGTIDVIMRKRAEKDENMKLAEESMNRRALQKASELAAFYEMIRPRSLRTVVEIGTSNGGVFYGLCQLASPFATLVSIDLPGGKFGGVHWADNNKLLKSYGKPRQRLEFIRQDSHKPGTLKKLRDVLDGKQIDLLFIDGDHTYEGCLRDYEMYAPLVQKGGIVAFHDICNHVTVPECQVEKVWKEVKRGKKTREFIDAGEATWGGIGVITT